MADGSICLTLNTFPKIMTLLTVAYEKQCRHLFINFLGEKQHISTDGLLKPLRLARRDFSVERCKTCLESDLVSIITNSYN